jgi:hypothetical protein
MVSEQAQFLLANLDWAAAELGNQNLVAGLHAGGDALSVLIEGAGADGNDLCFVEILDGCLWEEDASGSLGFGLDALHKDAVEEGHNAADRLDGGLSEHVSIGLSVLGKVMVRANDVTAELTMLAN